MAHCKVFVGSLPPGTKPKELRHLFQNFGIVIECDVMNRCGFIHMENPTMAETAILALHGSEFKGQNIVVEPGRQKDNDQKAIEQPPLANMICAPDQDIEDPDQNPNQGGMRGARGGFGSRRGMGRGGMPYRGGMGYFPGMSNRGGMNMHGPQGFGRGGGMGNRGGGMGNRGGGMGGGNPFAGPMREGFGGSGARGGYRGRGGGGRGGDEDSRNQSENGPIRHSPNFKTRPGPYEIPRGGGSQRGGPRGRGGFGAQNRAGTRFGDSSQQEEQPQYENGGFYHGSGGGGRGGNYRGKGNFMQHHSGQDRRGFTLEEPPHQHEQSHYGSSRPPMDRQNSFRGSDMAMEDPGYQPRFNPNMRGGGPNQRGRGRGSFGGRGRPFGGTDGQINNYNQEFPALAPVRGRGGFAGSRGGFNRHAPNMMPNHR